MTSTNPPDAAASDRAPRVDAFYMPESSSFPSC